MGRIDPNLRAVLDSLSLEKGVRHHTADLEYLRTLVNRLGPAAQDDEAEGPSTSSADHARSDLPETPSGEGAPELEAELLATQEERDELARRYAELEARIARLEGGPGHSGGLSFDDAARQGGDADQDMMRPEPETEVRFQRIDAPAAPPRRATTSAFPDDDIGFDDVHGEADPFAHHEDDEDIMEFEGVTSAAGAWGDAPVADDEGWQLGQIPDDQETDSWADPEVAPTPDADAEYERLMKELAELEADLDAIGAKPRPADAGAAGEGEEGTDEDQV